MPGQPALARSGRGRWRVAGLYGHLIQRPQQPQPPSEADFLLRARPVSLPGVTDDPKAADRRLDAVQDNTDLHTPIVLAPSSANIGQLADGCHGGATARCLNASIMLTVGAGDGVACVWAKNGTEVGTFATVGDVPNLSYQTVPLSGSLYLPAGTDLQVLCSDYNSVPQTSFYNGAITGVLINSPSGNAKSAATPVRHGLPPKL
jgi:hypothetical protein